MICISRKWSVFIYTLVLITLSVSMAMIVVTNVSILNNTFSDSQISQDLSTWLQKQFDAIKQRSDNFNSDGWGMTDNFWCPTNLVMSGSTTRTTNINSDYFFDGNRIICRADFSWSNLDLIFSNDYTTFITANLWGSDSVTLNWEYAKTAATNFSDSDASLLTFDSTYYNPDGIDDNFNSDDHSAQSSVGSNYPDGYLDNDSQAKTHIQWVVNNDNTWKNIFWNNTKIQDYIVQNTNNNISQTPNLWITGAVMYFWTDRPIDMRITEFRKSDFDQYGELIPINKNEFTISASGTGFLQNNGTLSASITGWEFNFDFVNRDYAIFLRNQDSSVAIYELYFQNNSEEKIISLPIRDDISNVFSYLWYNIIINSSGRYIYKIQEMFTDK